MKRAIQNDYDVSDRINEGIETITFKPFTLETHTINAVGNARKVSALSSSYAIQNHQEHPDLVRKISTLTGIIK